MKAAVKMFVVFVIAVIKLVLEINKNKYNNLHVVIVIDEINYTMVVSNYRSNICEVCIVDSSWVGNYSAVIELQRDVIMLSTCIVKLLSNEELEAVIAHELGHRFHRNRHISNYNKPEYELITEYEADAYACCTGHGRPLITALEKIVSNMLGINCIYDDINDPHIANLLGNTVKPRIKRIKRYLDS